MDRPKNGMNKIQPRQAQLMAQILRKITQHRMSIYFSQPVDWKSLGLSDYPLRITEPMDLSTVQKKLKGEEYATTELFFEDLLRIWKNCRIYNGEGHWLTNIAVKLEQDTKRFLKNYFPNMKLNRKKCKKQVAREAETQGCQINQYFEAYKKLIQQEQNFEGEQQINQDNQVKLENTVENAVEINKVVEVAENVEKNVIRADENELSEHSDEYKLKRLFLQALETVPDDRANMLFLMIKRRCPSVPTYDAQGNSIIDLTNVDYQTIYLAIMQILRWNEET